MSRGAGRPGLSGDRGLQPAGRPGSAGCSHSWARGGEEIDHPTPDTVWQIYPFNCILFSSLHTAARMLQKKKKVILWSSGDACSVKTWFYWVTVLPFTQIGFQIKTRVQELGHGCIFLVQKAGALQITPSDGFTKRELIDCARAVTEKVLFILWSVGSQFVCQFITLSFSSF